MSESVVYFIKPIGMDGPIKIGFSKNPERRMKSFATWCPFPLEIICTAPGVAHDEGRLHRRFANLHTHGEWFLSSPLLRETIHAILNGASIKSACEGINIKRAIRNQKVLPASDDRKLCIRYNGRIRDRVSRFRRKTWSKGHWSAPADVAAIITRWYGTKTHGADGIKPTPEQLAILDAFLAVETENCIFTPFTDEELAKQAAERERNRLWAIQRKNESIQERAEA